MQLVVDASSVINLINGGALHLLRKLRRRRFWVTRSVINEVWPTDGKQVLTEVALDGLSVIDDVDINVGRFLELLESYLLGAGETESIVACEVLGHTLCCDDRKARDLGRTILGENRVTGSIGILKWYVSELALDPTNVYQMYQVMIAKGGFLPNIRGPQYFAP